MEKAYWERLAKECGHKIDLTPEEVDDILSVAESRMVERTNHWGNAWYPEINYKGAWVSFNRTDMLDDVCTVWPRYKQDGADPKRYVGHNYGARIREDGSFSVIDRMTDG